LRQKVSFCVICHFCHRAGVLFLFSGIGSGEKVKQGDDDRVQDQYEGVQLIPGFEDGRRPFFFLAVFFSCRLHWVEFEF
jgi:hypothetical protein